MYYNNFQEYYAVVNAILNIIPAQHTRRRKLILISVVIHMAALPAALKNFTAALRRAEELEKDTTNFESQVKR